MGKKKEGRQKKPNPRDFLKITKPLKATIVTVIEEKLEHHPGWNCDYEVVEHIFNEHGRNTKSGKSRFDCGTVFELIAILAEAISRKPKYVFEIEEMPNHFERLIKMKNFVGWSRGEHTRWMRIIYERVQDGEKEIFVIKTAHPMRKIQE